MPPPSGAFLTHTYKETKQSPVSLFLRPLKAARLDFSKSLLLPPAKKDRESEDAASRKSLPRWQGALSGARALACSVSHLLHSRLPRQSFVVTTKRVKNTRP